MSENAAQAGRSQVVLVEDERNLRELFTDVLAARSLDVTAFETIADAEAYLAKVAPDVLVLDVKLPDGDGLALLERLRRGTLRCPAIIITAFGTVDRAVGAMRAGATDFLVKPFANERLLAAVTSAIETGTRWAEIELRAGTVTPSAEAADIVGLSGGLSDVAALLPRVAASAATVLIRGESGTGKELIARAIHAASAHMDGPFVPVNCAALPPSLLESELFGFERGAFTGAHARRKGLVEAADGGTLFLDEIGDMPLEAQARLLRVLQERQITRIGGREAVPVNVRIVAATHRPLEDMVKQGTFRADLLYRLAVVPIHLPPLRSRPQDIPGLVDHFLLKHAARHHAPAPRVDPHTKARVAAHQWPGNVRELENFVERAVVLGRFEWEAGPSGDVASDAVPATPAVRSGVVTLRSAVDEAERSAIVTALRAAGGNKAEAARLLGVSYKTLFNKINEHGIREELQIQ
jgi:DNA-binding NtrC family response regulator